MFFDPMSLDLFPFLYIVSCLPAWRSFSKGHRLMWLTVNRHVQTPPPSLHPWLQMLLAATAPVLNFEILQWAFSLLLLRPFLPLFLVSSWTSVPRIIVCGSCTLRYSKCSLVAWLYHLIFLQSPVHWLRLAVHLSRVMLSLFYGGR